MTRFAAAAALLSAATVAAGQDRPPAEPGTASTAASGSQRRTDRAAEAVLEAKLDRPVAETHPGGLTIPAGTPLEDALATLLAPAGLTVRPDRQALDMDGIDLADVPLEQAFSLPAGSAVRLRTLVKLLLTDSGEELCTLNRAGVLTVTTEFEAETVQFTRVYDVRDLVHATLPRAEAAGFVRRDWSSRDIPPVQFVPSGLDQSTVPTTRFAGAPADGVEPEPRGLGRLLSADAWEPVEVYDARPLIDVLLVTTGGQHRGGAWLGDGGFGTIEDLRCGPPGEPRFVLVVRQTERVHRQIADLLEDLRDQTPADGGRDE